MGPKIWAPGAPRAPARALSTKKKIDREIHDYNTKKNALELTIQDFVGRGEGGGEGGGVN